MVAACGVTCGGGAAELVDGMYKAEFGFAVGTVVEDSGTEVILADNDLFYRACRMMYGHASAEPSSENAFHADAGSLLLPTMDSAEPPERSVTYCSTADICAQWLHAVP
jgi:hypothetical protein